MSAKEIIKYYNQHKNKKYKEIAEKFSVSPQYVGRVLKDFGENNENKIADIKIMYYEKHMSMTDISNELDISLPSIRKILKETPVKFIEEKKKRKEKTREKNKAAKRNRRCSGDELIEEIRTMAYLEHAQRVCAIEDSQSRKLTNKDLINMNRQHYKYNPKKDRYEINMECAIPYGLPKVFKISAKYLSAHEDDITPGEFYGK